MGKRLEEKKLNVIIPIVCHKERAGIKTKLSGSQTKQTDERTDPLMDTHVVRLT